MTSRWTDAAVREALGLPPSRDLVEMAFSAVGTDSRTLEAGALFVALAGDRFDGHDYLGAARAAGALGAVVREGTPDHAGLRLYRVSDTTQALGALAAARRAAVEGPVVAITGSNGKTSTKEMIRAVLGCRFRTHGTAANLNNLIGIPLTILTAPEDTEALVIEAGASVPGEIARYREIISPTIAVVTNVSAAHLEGFGSLEAVLHEKTELLRDAPVAVVGTVPEALAARARTLAGRTIVAGLEGADVAPQRIVLDEGARATLTVDGETFTLPLSGRHLAANAMLAWAVGEEAGVPGAAAAAALTDLRIPGGRGELTESGGVTIFNDCYNANPASFYAAIATVEAIRGDRRVVWAVGTMRELGSASEALHDEVAGALLASRPDAIGAVGDFVPALRRLRTDSPPVIAAATPAELGAALAPLVGPGDLLVLKASRGVALEGIIAPLIESRSSTLR